MRIISGKWGGRRFTPPADKWPTRPTTDISKEGLFNILNNYLHFDQTIMLDLFGGTGNHCYEFLSRGCTDATYVDQHGPAVRFVQKMAKELVVEDELTIVRGDVAKFLAQPAHRKYDYVFAGPPYPLTWLDDIPNRLFVPILPADPPPFPFFSQKTMSLTREENARIPKERGKRSSAAGLSKL